MPRVVWRAGLDLNPLDVSNDVDVYWLYCLLWPGEGDRERRLTEAVSIARRDAPSLFQGDLLRDLAPLAAHAPSDATLVIYHSAVLAYVTEADRRSFAQLVGDLGAVWLSNEGPHIVPDLAVPPYEGSPFLLRQDSAALAFTDPHGTWLRWLE
jgi:hypothetical protein